MLKTSIEYMCLCVMLCCAVLGSFEISMMIGLHFISENSGGFPFGNDAGHFCLKHLCIIS